MRSNTTETDAALPRADSVMSADDTTRNHTRDVYLNDLQPPASVTQASIKTVTTNWWNVFPWHVITLFVVAFFATHYLISWKIEYVTERMTMDYKAQGIDNTAFSNETIGKAKSMMYGNLLLHWFFSVVVAIFCVAFHKQIGMTPMFVLIYLYTLMCVWYMQLEATKFVEHTKLNCYRNTYKEQINKGVNGFINSFAYKW